MTDTDDPSSEWISSLGIVDPASGALVASEARELIIAAGQNLFPTGPFKLEQLIIAGLVARAQSLHESAVDASIKNNPHAAFTLLRAYVEHCAAVLYIKDHPTRAENLWNDHHGHGVPIGKITNYAERSGRFVSFREVYRSLSKYAHPGSVGIFASMQVTGEDDGGFTWQSSPRFKSEGEQLLAFAWVVEFARMFHVLIHQYAESVGLGTIQGPQSSTELETGDDTPRN
ncbi:hypothetical protein ASF37_11675 [Aeromicrobium sp. Leaf289]|uniref:hypothetical protein n=1 Tax=Aeromicrobium sp. Leaf289 TaxID=1736324 RepID=UPI0006FC2E83|nr:hypothetical protein [Aeromicrobium sp. Leaf289]KQP77216.1 hypothetical protein ASF37_11675 [Aeromicrobium sp. Leaf289]